jgi:hypothetical protein
MYPFKQEVGGFARFELKRTLDSADQLALGKMGQRGELLDELACLVLRKAGGVPVSDRIVYGANQNERMKANAPDFGQQFSVVTRRHRSHPALP